MAMFDFNSLLVEAGIPIERTRLVRHQSKGKRTPYDLWLARDQSLERYQQIQTKEKFTVGDWLATFVVTPFGETLFVGIYHCSALGVAPDGTIDPLGGHDVSGLHHYSIELKPELAEYAGRIVVDWGAGYLAWVQQAKKQSKPIVELRKSSAIDPPFPGYARFRHSIRDLPSVPLRWRDALAAVSGIYLLASTTTGRLYVGSAYGDQGFWGRWEEYFRSGHGGNVGMRAVMSDELQVSILEIAASSATLADVIAMESLWKDRLLSRQFGLNLN